MLRRIKTRERPATRTPRWTRTDYQFGLRTMSSLTTKSQFAFELPNLTYIDASLEEANFRAPRARRASRMACSAWIAAFRAWREKQAAISELDMMSDRELAGHRPEPRRRASRVRRRLQPGSAGPGCSA